MITNASAGPLFFAHQGDPLYEAMYGFEVLMRSSYFEAHDEALHAYVADAKKAYETGMAIQEDPSLQRAYINALRRLKKEHDRLWPRISRQLDRLQSQQHYHFLHTLVDNRYGPIRNHPSVRLAEAVMKEEMASDDPATLFRQRLFHYKKQLMQAREHNVPARCLNAVTAMLHFMLKGIEASEDHECLKVHSQASKIQEYYMAAQAVCEEGLNQQTRQWLQAYRDTFEAACTFNHTPSP